MLLVLVLYFHLSKLQALLKPRRTSCHLVPNSIFTVKKQKWRFHYICLGLIFQDSHVPIKLSLKPLNTHPPLQCLTTWSQWNILILYHINTLTTTKKIIMLQHIFCILVVKWFQNDILVPNFSHFDTKFLFH